jgi:hypothetical protein
MPQVILTLLAFIDTPLGKAIIAVIPTFVNDVVAIWHQNGTIKTQDVADYLASQKAFDTLCPPKS